MTSALTLDARHDRTHLPHVLRAGIILGVMQTVLIAVFAFLQPRLAGPLELVVLGLVLVVGVAATIVLPGRWTEARTVEGISGAAGIIAPFGPKLAGQVMVGNSLRQVFRFGGIGVAGDGDRQSGLDEP
jgi:hypothetical protein